VTGFDFHPEAERDLAEIWDFIAEDSPDAADKVTENIVAGIKHFPYQVHKRTDRRMKIPCGLSQ
jgi:plasmid stabilization system protein ParE